MAKWFKTYIYVYFCSGILYAVGGYDGATRQCLSTVEAYNPKSNTWSYIAEMGTRRSGAGVCVFACVRWCRLHLYQSTVYTAQLQHVEKTVHIGKLREEKLREEKEIVFRKSYFPDLSECAVRNKKLWLTTNSSTSARIVRVWDLSTTVTSPRLLDPVGFFFLTEDAKIRWPSSAHFPLQA